MTNLHGWQSEQSSSALVSRKAAAIIHLVLSQFRRTIRESSCRLEPAGEIPSEAERPHKPSGILSVDDSCQAP